jgi:hypothetical protein
MTDWLNRLPARRLPALTWWGSNLAVLAALLAFSVRG